MNIKTPSQRRKAILAQVEQCVCADRQNSYGDAEDNFENIAVFWNVYLQKKLDVHIQAEDVAALMSLVKVARMIQSPVHMDNWIDLAGYATCGAGIIAGKVERHSSDEIAKPVKPECDQSAMDEAMKAATERFYKEHCTLSDLKKLEMETANQATSTTDDLVPRSMEEWLGNNATLTSKTI